MHAKAKNCMTPLSQALLLHSENLIEVTGSFPNISVALRIYHLLMITILHWREVV
jgi:hypothetical protein